MRTTEERLARITDTMARQSRELEKFALWLAFWLGVAVGGFVCMATLIWLHLIWG